MGEYKLSGEELSLCQLLYSMVLTIGGKVQTVWSRTVPLPVIIFYCLDLRWESTNCLEGNVSLPVIILWFRPSVGEYGLSGAELCPLTIIIYGLSGVELCPLLIIILNDSDHWWESTDCLEWNCALCQLLLYGLDC